MSRASSARSERGEPFPRRGSQGAVDTPFVTELNTPRRYSISVRSDRSENPAPSSARVIRRMSVIPRQKVKLPPLPQEEEQGFYDQNTLIQQYEALYEEVSALKKEIEPIRKQYLQLQDDLLYQSRCANSSEIDFAYYAPALSEAIGNGTFSSAIDNFQWQSFENTDEMSNLQSELSVYAVVRLAIEVDDARSELAEMRQNLEELKDQERQCRAQVARTKRQFPRQRILEQLDIIRDIQVSIARYELKNKKLEDEICDLEEQTAGRGRLDRRFYSPRGAGLYISAVLRPDIMASDCGKITAYAAVAAARATERLCGAPVSIKWVNDLYMNGKKICGVLTEGGFGMESGKLSYAVVGIGINTGKGEMPASVTERASDVFTESGVRVSRSDLAAALLDELADLPRAASTGDFIDEYRRRSCVIGRRVTVNGEYDALAVGIADDCSLILEKADGERVSFAAGEVSLKL